MKSGRIAVFGSCSRGDRVPQQVIFGYETSERVFDQMFYHPVILQPLLHIRASMYEELSS